MNEFLLNYFSKFKKLIKLDIKLEKSLIKLKSMVTKCSIKGNTVYLLGNGGSASIASHIAVDLSKNAKIRALNFDNSNLITCFSNDFGHKNWMKEALKLYVNKNDLIILISSSGKSENILNAAKFCMENRISLITFTGMKEDNELKNINRDGLNFWINSYAYNHIEMAHHFLLVCLVDMIIGKIVYKTKSSLI